MTYKRPASTVVKMVDLYGCRNPMCKFRLRTVPSGDPVPHHCGTPAVYINTLTKVHWDSIVAKNKQTICEIKGRIEAEKIRKERAA